MSTLYSDRGNLALGFHGCRKSVGDDLVAHPDTIKSSTNKWDWLGSGFYIWENNLGRALEWARNQYGDDGTAVGVVYELGTCLDLMDSDCINLLKLARQKFVNDMSSLGKPVPKNSDLKSDPNQDMILRNLDCAVINYLANRTEDIYLEEMNSNGYSKTKPFDSVRGCFVEGEKIPEMEIYEKTHIQIAIRNLNCIKGIFMPRAEIKFPVKR